MILKERTGGSPTSYRKKDVYKAQATDESTVAESEPLAGRKRPGWRRLFVSNACQAQGLRVLARRRSEGENVTMSRSGLP